MWDQSEKNIPRYDPAKKESSLLQIFRHHVGRSC